MNGTNTHGTINGGCASGGACCVRNVVGTFLPVNLTVSGVCGSEWRSCFDDSFAPARAPHGIRGLDGIMALGLPMGRSTAERWVTGYNLSLFVLFAVSLARIIHDFGDNESLLWYKHVEMTMF
jgi:hypothetical protein